MNLKGRKIMILYTLESWNIFDDDDFIIGIFDTIDGAKTYIETKIIPSMNEETDILYFITGYECNNPDNRTLNEHYVLRIENENEVILYTSEQYKKLNEEELKKRNDFLNQIEKEFLETD